MHKYTPKGPHQKKAPEVDSLFFSSLTEEVSSCVRRGWVLHQPRILKIALAYMTMKVPSIFEIANDYC